MIRAVLFDIDGVLLDSFEANLKFTQDLMAMAGYPQPTREEYLQHFHQPLWDSIQQLTGLTDQAKIEKIWELGKSRTVPYPVHAVKMPENADRVVRELSTTYALGIVTSRVRTSVFESPHLKALKQYFPVAISFEDTEEHKPHPAPLLLAAKQLNINQEAAVYIGDAASDITAARAAGMKVIIFSNKQFPEADAQTNNFKTIPELVSQLSYSQSSITTHSPDGILSSTL